MIKLPVSAEPDALFCDIHTLLNSMTWCNGAAAVSNFKEFDKKKSWTKKKLEAEIIGKD